METDEALRAEIRRLDVSARVSDVARGLEELAQEASRLKAAEGLNGRIAAVETRAAESKRVLWEEVQGKIERLDMVVTDPLDGIIARLTHECGGNVHKAGVVTVTASSVGYGQPENAVDFTSDSKFYTDNSRDSWIRYDFGNLRRRIC